MINPIPDNETMTNDTVSVEFDDKKLSDYTEKNGISGSTQETDESMLPPIFTQWTLSKRVHTTPHHNTPPSIVGSTKITDANWYTEQSLSN